jgi:hypothetical protein
MVVCGLWRTLIGSVEDVYVVQCRLQWKRDGLLVVYTVSRDS